MELTFAYFWAIKLAFWVIFLSLLGRGFYLTYKKKYNASLKWHILALFLALINILAPIKMETNTVQKQNYYDSQMREVRKEIPPRVSDDSFKKKTTSVNHLTTDEIWSEPNQNKSH